MKQVEVNEGANVRIYNFGQSFVSFWGLCEKKPNKNVEFSENCMKTKEFDPNFKPFVKLV